MAEKPPSPQTEVANSAIPAAPTVTPSVPAAAASPGAASPAGSKDSKPASPQDAAEPAADQANKAQVAKEAMKRRAQALQGAMLKSDTSARISGTLKQINSKDRPSRMMARLFLVSLLGIAFTVAAVIRHFNSRTPPAIPQSEEDHVAEFVAQQQGENEAVKLENLDLGSFEVELKPPVGEDKPIYGVMNIVQFQLILGCDGEDTQSYIETHAPQARNQLTNALLHLTREDFLTLDGKKRTKRMIIKTLNDWLPNGKVVEVFFTKLVIN